MHRLVSWLCLFLTITFGLSHSKGHALQDTPNYYYAACADCNGPGDFYDEAMVEEEAPACPELCPPPCPPKRGDCCATPCAAICGAECGISICAIAVAVAALIAAAAIILSAGDGNVDP